MRAADSLLLSQPTISEHLLTLEERLWEKLSDRLRREVFPNTTGQILYRYPQEMLHLSEKAIQEIATKRANSL